MSSPTKYHSSPNVYHQKVAGSGVKKNSSHHKEAKDTAQAIQKTRDKTPPQKVREKSHEKDLRVQHHSREKFPQIIEELSKDSDMDMINKNQNLAISNYLNEKNIRYMTNEEKDFKLKLMANDLQIKDEKIGVQKSEIHQFEFEISGLNRTISKQMSQYESEKLERDKTEKKKQNKHERHARDLDEYIKKQMDEISRMAEKSKIKVNKLKAGQKNTKDELEFYKNEILKANNQLEHKDKEIEKLLKNLDQSRSRANDCFEKVRNYESKYEKLGNEKKSQEKDLNDTKKSRFLSFLIKILESEDMIKRNEKELEKIVQKVKKKGLKVERLIKEKDSSDHVLQDAKEEM